MLAVATAGCLRSKDVSLEYPTPEPPAAATPLPKLELKRDAALEAEFAKIAEAAKGKVGVAAVVIETGEAALLNADDRYQMQSVYKLPIAMAVMDQVRLGKLDLDEVIGVTPDDFVRKGMASPLRDKNPSGGEFTIRELIRLALVESDGSASDVLIRVAGGASEIQAYLEQIGIHDMKVANSEKEIGRDWATQYQNWATPLASVELLRWLDADAKGWRPPNLDQELHGSQILLQVMMQSVTGPKRLKGLVPNGYPITIAHKTGTGGIQNGITSATNDIGIIYTNDLRIAIAVYVSDSPADQRTRETVIARMAKAAYDRWSKAVVKKSTETVQPANFNTRHTLN